MCVFVASTYVFEPKTGVLTLSTDVFEANTHMYRVNTHVFALNTCVLNAYTFVFRSNTKVFGIAIGLSHGKTYFTAEFTTIANL